MTQRDQQYVGCFAVIGQFYQQGHEYELDLPKNKKKYIFFFESLMQV